MTQTTQHTQDKNTGVKPEPYLYVTRRECNPRFPSDSQCVCGHPYHRHFDSYDNNDPVGCKYCACDNFVEDDGAEEAVIAKIKLEHAQMRKILLGFLRDGYLLTACQYNDKLKALFNAGKDLLYPNQSMDD